MSSQGRARKEKTVRSFDFLRPNKLSRDHVRILSVVQESFTRGVSTQIASVLRTMSHMETSSIEQRTWNEFSQEWNSPCHVTVLSLSPLPGATILVLPLEAAYSIVELMMGGSNVLGRSFPDRPLSEIENTLLRTFLERQLPELRAAFSPVCDITPRILGTESSPQFAQVAGPSDPVVHTKYTLQIDTVETHVAMCTPWSSLSLILEDTMNKGALTTVQFDKVAVKKRLVMAANEVQVGVSARFAPCSMTAEEIFSLSVGDVVRLGSSLDAPLTLFAENQATHLVKPGRSGRKVAVEVIDAMMLGKPQEIGTGDRR